MAESINKGDDMKMITKLILALAGSMMVGFTIAYALELNLLLTLILSNGFWFLFGPIHFNTKV